MKKIAVSIFLLSAFCFQLSAFSFAQEPTDLEYTLDAASDTAPLPGIFKPNIDLSGRGFHPDAAWPQTLAAKEALDMWEKEIGFSGMFRMQLSLWDIYQLAKEKDLQNKLLENYESVIKKVSDAGGITILDIFGTPPGMGEARDKKSPPRDLREFKKIIKNLIQDLSCKKKYKIWYEVWNAPDLDDFFLGRKQEYFNIYRAVAESIKELEAENKIHIPVGGPSVSWWFQNLDPNTILTPEKSLIYELIKFCYRYRLPLDFITWHGYSTSPAPEKENTVYNKTAVKLIRDWLSYFNFNSETPLIVDEWNYDLDANLLPGRAEQSYIAASYIPSRVKNMRETGIDYQLYFCLEDFKNNKEGVVRNLGIFYFDVNGAEYKGGTKATYNLFRMLNSLGSDIYNSNKFLDEFVGVIATKRQDAVILLIYNYIDPDIAINYLSENISALGGADKKVLLRLIKSEGIENILRKDPKTVRATKKVKSLFKKTKELYDTAAQFKSKPRKLNLRIDNIKTDNYLYQRYAIDSACGFDCPFEPAETKELEVKDYYEESLELSPYSVNMVVLKQKPPEPEKPPEKPEEETAGEKLNQADAQEPAAEQPVKQPAEEQKETPVAQEQKEAPAAIQ
jgi:beta-xylosidase